MSTARTPARPRRPTAGHDEATGAFLDRAIAVQDLLCRLQQAADNHWGAHPGEVTWGHVGSLTEVEELLRRAADFIGA